MSEEKHATLRALDALQVRGLEGKRDYVASLEARGDEQALSLLVECLCDESAFLRELAEQALGRIGESAAEVLLPHLTQGLWYTRASVARVLGRMGCRGAVDGLTALVADDNGAVAEAATGALTALAESHAVAVARALHRAAPGTRQRVLHEAARATPELARQLERLLADRDLMTAQAEEVLREDTTAAGAHENLEWEVLTGRETPRQERQEKRPPRSG